MNSKIKSLAFMTAMMAMSNPIPFVEHKKVIKKDTSHLRKKCKSCKQFRGTYCSIKSYIKPQNVACEKYEPKNK